MNIFHLNLLYSIQKYFGGIGTIVNFSDMCAFRVTSPNAIFTTIFTHFDKFPLITQKQSDYLLFKQIVVMMLQGKHLQMEGLQTIVNVRASLNLGLSESLKEAFPETIPVSRPLVDKSKIPDPE